MVSSAFLSYSFRISTKSWKPPWSLESSFEDVGHSTDARELMAEYLIGTLQESDRKGTSNTGPKSWASSGDSSSGGGDEGSSLMTWIVPAVLAFAGSMVYRTYFAKS